MIMAELKSMRDNISMHQKVLLENLELQPVLRFCTSRRIISEQTEMEIKSKPTPHDQNFKFLNVLNELKDDHLLIVINKLAANDVQPHLGNLITGMYHLYSLTMHLL